MTTAIESVNARAVAQPYPTTLPYDDRDYATRRLDEAYHNAKLVPIDRDQKYIFMSDCHRGDNSSADAFAPNEALYLEALQQYYDQGYTYVEVGDGDELWQNRRFDHIRHAHERTFDLLHGFQNEKRLHLVFGNHDISQGRYDTIRKDGIVAQESLVLYDIDSGHKLFVVHGHQADFVSDRLYRFSRRMVRLYKMLQLVGLGNPPNRGKRTGCRLDLLEPTIMACGQAAGKKIEWRIVKWAQSWKQAVICGHTHRAVSDVLDGVPYLNTGSCVMPGHITGLELHQGRISLVSWSRPSGSNRGRLGARRRLLAPVQAVYA